MTLSDIKLLAAYQTVLLHSMTYGKTFWGGVLASLDNTSHNKTTFLFCLLSLLRWSKLNNPWRILPPGIQCRVVRWNSIDFCSACHLLSRWFLARLILWPWRWRQYIPPKRELTFNGLHYVVSQKVVLFITTSVRTSNPAQSIVTFPSCAWIRCSLRFRRSSTYVEFGLSLFQIILFRTFPTNRSIAFVRNSSQNKVWSFADYRFMFYRFFYLHISSFRQIFLQTKFPKEP
jgi:hypothetical protein